MGFLKQLLGKYVSGSHGMSGGHGKKHGGYGGKHGDRSGYSEPYTRYDNPPMTNQSGKVCSRCNTMNLNDAKFCQQCGTGMLSSNCSQCNTALLPDAKFCPQCGKARQ